MEIRPLQPADLDRLDIDATIESTRYLHLEKTGAGMAGGWTLEARPLRDKLILGNAIDDELRFLIKTTVEGTDEGIALAAEHQDRIVGLLVAQPRPGRGILRLADLRIDSDFRRQGVATAMTYQTIAEARRRGLRAVFAETRTNNDPANQFMMKMGFEMDGLDTRRYSNHDLVKEAASLFWYAPLD